MKKVFEIFIAIILFLICFKFMLPWQEFPFEHYEYQVANYLPFNWKVISIISRMILGIVLVFATFLILRNKKVKFLKYFAIISISIPFILNPVFPKDLVDDSSKPSEIQENLAFKSNYDLNKKTVLLYASPQCSYCKEAAFRLNEAKKRNKDFPEVLVVSYNRKLSKLFKEQKIELPIDSIDTGLFMKITEGSFPKFQLVENNELVRKWKPEGFNYAVLDNLSESY